MTSGVLNPIPLNAARGGIALPTQAPGLVLRLFWSAPSTCVAMTVTIVDAGRRSEQRTTRPDSGLPGLCIVPDLPLLPERTLCLAVSRGRATTAHPGAGLAKSEAPIRLGAPGAHYVGCSFRRRARAEASAPGSSRRYGSAGPRRLWPRVGPLPAARPARRWSSRGDGAGRGCPFGRAAARPPAAVAARPGPGSRPRGCPGLPGRRPTPDR